MVTTHRSNVPQRSVPRPSEAAPSTRAVVLCRSQWLMLCRSGRGFGAPQSPDAAGQEYSPEYSAEMLKQQARPEQRSAPQSVLEWFWVTWTTPLLSLLLLLLRSSLWSERPSWERYPRVAGTRRRATSTSAPRSLPLSRRCASVSARRAADLSANWTHGRDINLVAGRWPPRCTAVRCSGTASPEPWFFFLWSVPLSLTPALVLLVAVLGAGTRCVPPPVEDRPGQGL